MRVALRNAVTTRESMGRGMGSRYRWSYLAHFAVKPAGVRNYLSFRYGVGHAGARTKGGVDFMAVPVYCSHLVPAVVLCDWRHKTLYGTVSGC